MWGTQTIAQLVYNSNNYGFYGTYNELVTGAYKPTYNRVAPQNVWWACSSTFDYQKTLDVRSTSQNH